MYTNQIVIRSVSHRHTPDILSPIPENGIDDEERRQDDFEIQLSDDSDIQTSKVVYRSNTLQKQVPVTFR